MARPPRSAVSNLHVPTITPDVALKRLNRLLEEIPDVRFAGPRSAKASTWEGSVKIVLSEFYGENSVVAKQFSAIWFAPGMYYPGQPESEFVTALNSGLDQATGFLESRISDLQDQIGPRGTTFSASSYTQSSDSRKVFVVHGHDLGNKETVARFLERLDLDPIVLHEQSDQGRTIIEKFEAHASDVGCAVVILTSDDVAAARSKPDEKELRARQNVILEFGYFVGRLGRKRTFALVEKGVKLPSDMDGLVYIPLDDGQWRIRLVKELKSAGFDVDANRAF